MLAVCRFGHSKKALEMALTGGFIDAFEAYRMGLINKVVPAQELEEAALQLAEAIADKSPVAVRLGKLFYHATANMTFEQGMAYAREMLSINAVAEDFKEGLKAFLEKRQPRWDGK